MLPLVALVVVAIGVACLGLGRLGGSAADAATAQTAADAAALAGVVAGEGPAGSVAAANDGVLVSFERVGPLGDVRVRVRVGRAIAVARARFPPGGAG
ncbi:MAG: hypothetical protein QOF60_2906 [Actinomycetota bacterium]|nr:hypothetical protein [Actinomycetota bacterium]